MRKSVIAFAISALLACNQNSNSPIVAGSESETIQNLLNVNGLSVSSDTYNVGASRIDITGPFVQESTGYNNPGDTMNGLAMRLYSRAFVIEQPGGKTIAIATADQLHLYQSIKLGVIKKLAADGYGGVFQASNVMVSATHTHAATSNHSWYTLFNLFNGVTGFDRLHYQVVVNGIANSIERAYDNRRAAVIKIATGIVEGAAHNRSSIAYSENPDAADYDSNVDKTMTLLRFDGTDGTPIGALNWFGVHGTSLGINNHRIHGNNKGWAAYEFERQMGGNFVAAFAQTTVGDSSPNEPDPSDITLAFLRPTDLDPSLDSLENPIIHGQKQLTTALQLYNDAVEMENTSVDFRHSYVNFNNVAVENQYIGTHRMPYDVEVDANQASTCVATVGAAFLAGDEEGAPVDFAEEGEIRNTFTLENGQWVRHEYNLQNLDGIAGILGDLWPLASQVLQSDKYDQCAKEKLALLPVGEVDDFWFPNPQVPFIPVDVPLQIFRIGDLAITGSSFEVTTMVGRRLQATIGPTLENAGVHHVVVASMANSYTNYLATREEYAAQHYEGSFTVFGPFAAAALRQEMDRLATNLASGTASDPGPVPPDLSNQQLIQTWISQSGVVNDTGDFGKVLSGPAASYSAANDEVQLVFQAAHPRTELQKKEDGSLSNYYDPESYTFIEVQRKVGSSWQTVATDQDPYTSFQWVRTGGDLSGTSEATVIWQIRNQPAGTYRIKYNGLARRWYFFWTSYQKFTGTSPEFQLL
ncbi:MAG: neutral/alkaline non-lysosomal ceramidase N-terminal domain-containing protein [Leptospiraceae bacterium]|nr:neutral/alkaline non-lysosomal ceramidase N-terminal domain-containing protein [Leptospiraceae bacterium]